MRSPSAPNFLGKCAAALRWSLVNDASTLIMFPALVVGGGLHVLG